LKPRDHIDPNKEEHQMTAFNATLATLSERLRREEGQGSIEYLGVVIAAALIVLAIIGVATGIGDDIAGGIGDKVTEILGSG